MAKTITLFMGGTCNDSTWRDDLQKHLYSTVQTFNPVVANWDEAAKHRELYARKTSDFVLYTITPKMTGVYSIAEVVDDSNKRPKKTLFCVLPEDDGYEFTSGQLRSLNAVKEMIEINGAKSFNSLEDVAQYLNKKV